MIVKSLSQLLMVLASTCWLIACSGSPNVEFEPAETQAPQEQQDPSAAAVEVISYSGDVASSAEQLYGADPGDANPIYKEALKSNPNLGYTILYFDFNSIRLKESAREVLSHHAQFMQSHPEVVLLIEGHADKQGSAGYNLALGERRALAIKDALQAYGVDIEQIRSLSYGEERPAVEGEGEDVYNRNRRGELIYR